MRYFGAAKKCVHQYLEDHQHIRRDQVGMKSTYNPPEVGIAEPKSAMASPTMKINMQAKNHDHTIPAGPAGME